MSEHISSSICSLVVICRSSGRYQAAPRADIANVCNEAALIAARHDKKSVSKQDFLDAVDRIVGGLEKKTKVMTAWDKKEKVTIVIQ